MNDRRKLQSMVIDFTGSILNDCETFTKLRVLHNNLYKELGLGGGNFLMAMGLMSVFDFLANLYSILSGLTLPNEIDEKSLTKFKKDIKNLPNLDQNIVKRLNYPKPGSLKMNTNNAFVRFVQKLEEDKVVCLGLDLMASSRAWKVFRDKLHHMLASSYPIVAVDRDLSSYSWVEIVHDLNKMGKFFVKDDLIMCNVDSLTQALHKIVTWFCKYIDGCNQENITTALKWIDNEIYPFGSF